MLCDAFLVMFLFFPYFFGFSFGVSRDFLGLICPEQDLVKKVLWGVFRGLNTFLEGIWSPRVLQRKLLR